MSYEMCTDRLPRPDYRPIDPDHPVMVVARARAELLNASTKWLAEVYAYQVRYPESTGMCGAVNGVLAHIPFGRHELELQAAARTFIEALDAPNSPWPLEDTIGDAVEQAWSQTPA